MGFLDNLESDLKNLESQEERDPNAQKNRNRELAAAQAIAPWAEKLKASPYAQEVMNSATRLGFETRTKVHMAWLGTSLRLESKERRLELRPTADGIIAVFLLGGKEQKTLSIDLAGNAAELVHDWLR